MSYGDSNFENSFGLKLKKIDWSKADSSRNDSNNKSFHQISEEANLIDKKNVKEFRNALGIKVSEKDTPNPVIDFQMANFPSFILEAMEEKGFKKPTPIQSQTWPIVFAGRNMIGVAETGSGKTLAFALPAIRNVLSLVF
ncbi:hypothetical protein MHBO_003219 [Bonamia ostreae]|uniref:DEAD-box RNA helicase Q domain-containing protein n=1 Tax=Bonamia ostreae TaxID=126728 RepID=A0ABV2APS8_9EUKA